MTPCTLLAAARVSPSRTVLVSSPLSQAAAIWRCQRARCSTLCISSPINFSFSALSPSSSASNLQRANRYCSNNLYEPGGVSSITLSKAHVRSTSIHFALLAAAASVSAICFSNSNTAYCNSSSTGDEATPTFPSSQKQRSSGDESNSNSKDEKYEIDEDCPFCRYFLESPCRQYFIAWHGCVQRSAKPTDCMEPFRPLKACMDENDMLMEEEEGEAKQVDDTEDS